MKKVVNESTGNAKAAQKQCHCACSCLWLGNRKVVAVKDSLNTTIKKRL